jgi:hypothetical protein
LYKAFVIGAPSAQHLIADPEFSSADIEHPVLKTDDVSSKVLDARQSVYARRVWSLTSTSSRYF